MSERVVLLQHPPIIGQNYLVPCVRYKNKWWPVIGRQHSDPVLGEEAIKPHIHIDVRFVEDGNLLEEFDGHVWQAYPDDPRRVPSWYIIIFVVFIKNGARKKYVEEREMKCLREGPRLAHRMRDRTRKNLSWHTGDSLNHHANLEKMMEQKKLKGICKLCPHHGVPLGSIAPIDGIITCPAHGMDWSAKTGRLVRRTVEENGVVRHREHHEKKLDIEGES